VRPTRSVVLDMVEEFIDTIGRLEGLVRPTYGEVDSFR
jgi:hypothetical protein